MAAELVGGALLSSLFNVLFDKLASRNLQRVFQKLKVNEGLLRKLKTMLWPANQVLDDAEEKQLTNPDVREWLFELKETIYEAEDVLDGINYRTLQYQQERKPRSGSVSKKFQSFLTRFSTFDEAVERKIEEILDRLKYIVKQKDVLGLKEGVTNRLSQRLPAPLVDECCVYGRNDDKEKIINLLLSDNDSSSSNKISVIPIVGMGGIGKTTLAQLVYEDARVKSQFDIRSWVTVSDESDISIVGKRILEEITSKKCETEGLYQLQSKLKEALSNKSYLLVLDDVWNESYDHWDVLLSSFQSGAYGSKIIVTTRSDIVAKRMGDVPAHHLETVSDEDCWKLFEEHVFKNASSDTYEHFHVIARDVVKKCKGIPLAVKSLAGLLRSVLDLEQWKGILNNDIWELQLQGNQSNNILPSLWLSYNYLPMHLKRCFAYCSIFPKDYVMNEPEKETIIQLWMAEGLLQQGKRGKQIEDVGKEYFQDLISRSLFQPLSKDKSTILMHDLMHDLAVFVSGEFSFRLDDSDRMKFSSKTCHFSYSKIDDLDKFEGLSSAKSLRTSLLLPSCHRGCSSSVLQQKLLVPEGGCLRALGRSRSHLTILPHSIGNLKHLRYLDLSWNDITEIPNTFCSLYNLQTLLLSWCRQLTALPIDMGKLVNLRHLDIEGVPLKKMPPKMRHLEVLQTLSNFVVGKKDGSSVKELGGLQYLSGKLEISELQNVDVVGDVLEANLKDKEYISKLVFHWSLDDSSNDLRKDREVLDALQPHSNLRELVINGYRGETFSNWVGHCSYTNMVTMNVGFCYNCRSLPPLGQLPSLQYLKISDCIGVERIGVEFYSDSLSNIKPFRSLKSLEFVFMSAWQEWSFPEIDEGVGCFPSLEHLGIIGCPKLNVCLPDYFPSLKTFNLRGNVQTTVLPGNQLMGTTSSSLELLNITDCPKLETFLLTNFPSNLKKLYISGYVFDYSQLPETKAPLCLVIIGCEDRIQFPEALLPATLTSLHIYGLENLRALNGEGLQHLTCLEELRIEDCEELQCFPGEGLPTSLTSLHLQGLTKLEDLGNGLQHLISLKELRISNCQSLKCLSENGLPMSLTSLHISSLPSLKVLASLEHLVSLEELEIGWCNNLQYCSLEENARGFKQLILLKSLEIRFSNNLQSLLEVGLPTSLTSLCISGFPNLRDLNSMGFQHLNSLKQLQIGYCRNLRRLPEEGLPSSLSSLEIYKCPLLEPRCQIGTGKDWHNISHIPHLKIDSYQRN